MPALAVLVESQEDCAGLTQTLSAVNPAFAEICDGPPPDGASCEDVCTRIARECAMVENPAQEIAACTEACEADTPTPAQLECAMEAACQNIEACADLEPQPDPDGQCRAACERAFECEDLPPGIDREELIGQCIPECLQETTPAERQCVIAAECNAIENCQGVMPPGGDIEDECRQACDVAVQCGELPPQAHPECVDGCLDASTAHERACVINNADDCGNIEACIEGGEPPPDPPGGDVARECAEACQFVVGCEDIPDDFREIALAECQQGCVDESTAEERACINALEACEGREMCFGMP